MINIEYFAIDVGKGKSFVAHYCNNEFINEFELIHNKVGFESSTLNWTNSMRIDIVNLRK
ncbi:hypothetical protein [Staphylococcus hominis]|uniref:hypothetical protein n=1 Tax=Staphylococcus hominis TaxID=1290 RepID=UPI0015A5D8FA|nr:hypothetical protein [Staphylococcus hominis]